MENAAMSNTVLNDFIVSLGLHFQPNISSSWFFSGQAAEENALKSS